MRVFAIALATLLLTTDMVMAGAPRKWGRFVNSAGTRDWPGPGDTLPFFLRKAWTSLVPRSGAARVVPFSREALAHNPSITWIGHSTMLVRMGGVTFLTDPIFSDVAGPANLVGARRLVPPGVPLAALPPVDFVLLSHDHYDHTDLPSVRDLARSGARFIVPLGLGQLVRDAGGQATELDWWQATKVGRARVHCVPAQHFAGRGILDGNRRLWAGWVIEAGRRKFYHAGDTGYFGGFGEIGERLGPIDVAAVPIGAYLPSSIMRYVHMDPAEAMQAAVDMKAATVVGMHYGTFDLTDEPLDEPPRWFRAEAEKRGLGRDQVWTLDIGETRRF
jgi:N-acyl-phosphatidylethanolamine-hydrolysing phospholipase D